MEARLDIGSCGVRMVFSCKSASYRREHSYSHWLWLDIDPGVYKLWALCRDYPSAAFPGARDEAPPRLVSWLSFRLSQKCHEFIQTAMDKLCSDKRVDLLSLGQDAFPDEQLPHLEGMKEFLLSEVALAFLVCVVVCVSFLAPSHKSCGVFQVSVEGHWTYSWADALVPQSLHVSLTWAAGVPEICCSLRAKKNLAWPCGGTWSF